MAKLSSSDSLPVRAIIACLLLTLVLGILGIGSLTALSAVLGGAVVCGMISFALVLAAALHRGRDFLDPQRCLNLGKLGLTLQVVGLFWCLFASVWLCFPAYLPVTLNYMNWTSVVVTGVTVASAVYWFVSRSTIPSARQTN